MPFFFFCLYISFHIQIIACMSLLTLHITSYVYTVSAYKHPFFLFTRLPSAPIHVLLSCTDARIIFTPQPHARPLCVIRIRRLLSIIRSLLRKNMSRRPSVVPQRSALKWKNYRGRSVLPVGVLNAKGVTEDWYLIQTSLERGFDRFSQKSGCFKLWVL